MRDCFPAGEVRRSVQAVQSRGTRHRLGDVDWSPGAGRLWKSSGQRVRLPLGTGILGNVFQVRNIGRWSAQGRARGDSPIRHPCVNQHGDFRARVEQLPDLDNPASFGMAPNADRSLQRINSAKAISLLRQLATSGGDAGDAAAAAVDIKVWKTQLAPLFTIWDNMNTGHLSKLRGVEIRAVRPDDPPSIAFILMDAAEASRLGEVVTAALSTLQRVVNGQALSTPDLQVQARALIQGEVPESWSVTWPSAPEDPSLYLQGLAKRIASLKGEWVRRVQSQTILSQPICLSDFLRPDVFLNALRQETARRLAISIDSLHLVSTFEPHLLSDESSPLPVTVQELILEGCAFDESKRMLIEGQRNSPLVSMLPPMTIAWMSRATHPERTASSARAAGTISLPGPQQFALGHPVECLACLWMLVAWVLRVAARPVYASLTRERLIAEAFRKIRSSSIKQT